MAGTSPTSEELRFILTMRDNASKKLRGFTSQMRSAAREAKATRVAYDNLGRKVGTVTRSFELANEQMEAARRRMSELSGEAVAADMSLRGLAENTRDTRDAMQGARRQIQLSRDAVQSLTSHANTSSNRIQDMANAARRAEDSFSDFEDDVERARDTLEDFNDTANNTDDVLGRMRNGIRGSSDDMSSFNRNSDRTTRVLRRLGIRTAGLSGIFLRLGAAIGTVVAPTVGAAGLTAVVALASQAAGEIADLAERVNLATSEFQKLQFATRQLGVDQKNLSSGLQDLLKAAQDFTNLDASNSIRNAFGQLGLSREQVQGLKDDTESLFRTVIRRARTLSETGERQNVLEQLFGSAAGEQFLNVVAQSNGRIGELETAFTKLGATLNEDAATSIEKVNKLLTAFWQTLKNQVITAVAANAEEIRNLVEDALAALPGVIDRVVTSVKFLVRNLEQIQTAAFALGGAFIGSIFGPWGAAIGGVVGLITTEFIPSLDRLKSRQEAVNQAVRTLVDIGNQDQAIERQDEFVSDLRERLQQEVNSFKEQFSFEEPVEAIDVENLKEAREQLAAIASGNADLQISGVSNPVREQASSILETVTALNQARARQIELNREVEESQPDVSRPAASLFSDEQAERAIRENILGQIEGISEKKREETQVTRDLTQRALRLNDALSSEEDTRKAVSAVLDEGIDLQKRKNLLQSEEFTGLVRLIRKIREQNEAERERNRLEEARNNLSRDIQRQQRLIEAAQQGTQALREQLRTEEALRRLRQADEDATLADLNTSEIATQVRQLSNLREQAQALQDFQFQGEDVRRGLSNTRARIEAAQQSSQALEAENLALEARRIEQQKGVEIDDAKIAKREELLRQQRESEEQLQRLKNAREALNQEERNVEELQRLIESARKGEEAFRETKAQIEAEKEVLGSTATSTENLTSKQQDLIDKLAESKQQGSQFRETLDKLKENFDSASGSIQTFREEVSQVFNNAQQSVVSSFEDLFRGVLDNNLSAFKDFGDDLVDVAKDTQAQIAAAFAKRKLINPIFAQAAPFISTNQAGGLVFNQQGGGQGSGQSSPSNAGASVLSGGATGLAARGAGGLFAGVGDLLGFGGGGSQASGGGVQLLNQSTTVSQGLQNARSPLGLGVLKSPSFGVSSIANAGLTGASDIASFIENPTVGGGVDAAISTAGSFIDPTGGFLANTIGDLVGGAINSIFGLGDLDSQVRFVTRDSRDDLVAPGRQGGPQVDGEDSFGRFKGTGIQSPFGFIQTQSREAQKSIGGDAPDVLSRLAADIDRAFADVLPQSRINQVADFLGERLNNTVVEFGTKLEESEQRAIQGARIADILRGAGLPVPDVLQSNILNEGNRADRELSQDEFSQAREEAQRTIETFKRTRDLFQRLGEDGQLVNGQIAQINQNAQQLGSQALQNVRTLLDNVERFGLASRSEAQQRAREGIERILGLGDQQGLTETEASLRRVQERFEALQPALEATGLTAAEAQEKIAEATEQAQARIRGQRIAGLRLEAEGLSQVGSRALNIASGIPSLQQDQEALPGLSQGTVSRVIRQRVSQLTQGLSGDEIELLRSELARFSGQIPGVNRLLEALADSTSEAGESLSNLADRASTAISDAVSSIDDRISTLSDARSDIREFRRNIQFSDQSTLSPVQQFTRARSRFNDLADRAQSGDVEAIQRLRDAGQRLLELNETVNASTNPELVERVRNRLRNTESAAQQQIGELKAQKTLLDQQLTQLRENNNTLAQVRTAVEQAQAIIQGLPVQLGSEVRNSLSDILADAGGSAQAQANALSVNASGQSSSGQGQTAQNATAAASPPDMSGVETRLDALVQQSANGFQRLDERLSRVEGQMDELRSNIERLNG